MVVAVITEEKGEKVSNMRDRETKETVPKKKKRNKGKLK
jgi:hypothetical protein